MPRDLPAPLSTPLDRRTAVKGAAAVAGAVAGARALRPRPAGATDATDTAAGRVFQHGVASGDPLPTAVLLWTRVTPSAAATPGSGAGPSVAVRWQVAGDPGFRTVLREGTARTSAARDHTVKVDVHGLQPYTRYWYRFTALGSTSPVGRTQTAAGEGRVHALRLGFVSCSNWTGGFFAAYRHLARRGDLDAVLHLGDYLYEYGNGADRYGPDSLAGRRDHVPATEVLTLADYRARHGQYKTDPDLQAAHAAYPWIVTFDDHEVANNTYDTGAENHTPGVEGDFAQRRAAAYRAYVEWMPLRVPDQHVRHEGQRFWRRFSFGPLADLSVLETRQNRSEQVPASDSRGLADPGRVLVEPEQMAWLKDGVGAGGRSWHLLANQVVLTRVQLQPGLPGQDRLGRLGYGTPPFNTDQWDGYQDDQRELTLAMQASPADTVVLTGDIHSSWANEVPVDPGTYAVTGDSAGVEFVCPSVTSDGFAEILGGPQAAQAATTALQVVNPNIKYLDGVGHGYAVLDVTPARVQADFWHLSDRTDPQATQHLAASWQTRRGSRAVEPADGPVGRRSDVPTPGSRR